MKTQLSGKLTMNCIGFPSFLLDLAPQLHKPELANTKEKYVHIYTYASVCSWANLGPFLLAALCVPSALLGLVEACTIITKM